VGDPVPGQPLIRNSGNNDLFKPFDTGRTFHGEAVCRADGVANLTAYLAQHGLPTRASGGVVCTSNRSHQTSGPPRGR
jgi:hypothetical protein